PRCPPVLASAYPLSFADALPSSTCLAQIPGFTHDCLHGDESVVSLILAVFSIGIAAGSLLCERLAGRTVNLGLVPIGAAGLTLFGLLLWVGAGQLAVGVE